MKSTSEKKTVLLIDDDERFAELLTEYLSQFEFRIIHAPEATRGRAILAKEEVDIAIVDWMMPEIDGPRLIKDVRSWKPRLPILMISARGDLGSSRYAVDSGANSFLSKPFRLKELLEQIRSLLDRSSF